jgi:hypothetical protein
MSQRKTLSKVPLTPQFTTNGLSYANVVKFDKSNHVQVWDHSYSTTTRIQSVEENCTHDHSYVKKNTSVTKIPVIDHSKSKAKADHSYADVVKCWDTHKNKYVGDHSYACTVEESGALHNEKSIIPNPQIEQGDKQDCVIEDGVFHDKLSKNSMALVLADIKYMPSQLTYVDNNLFLSYSIPGDGNCFFSFDKFSKMSSSSICKRCNSDKNSLKLFSFQNIMDPQSVPPELSDLSIIEQQLICRISPCINMHMLKHGGIASAGYCVIFPQELKFSPDSLQK